VIDNALKMEYSYEEDPMNTLLGLWFYLNLRGIKSMSFMLYENLFDFLIEAAFLRCLIILEDKSIKYCDSFEKIIN
jgi:hypothetical protein